MSKLGPCDYMFAEKDEAVKLGSLPNFLRLSIFRALKEVCIVSNLIVLLTNSHVKAKLR